jgi:type I restriction enzyme R subunit
LQKLNELGFGDEQLEDLQKIVNAQNSDLFDALAYVNFLTKPISRLERVESRREKISGSSRWPNKN